MKETNREPLWGERPEPFTLLQDLVMNWWVILLAGLAGLMLATVAAGTRYTPRYTARATYAVASKQGANAFSNLSAANQMAQTFGKILQSSLMTRTIEETLGDEELDAQISARVIENTNLLELSVTGASPRQVTDVIRAVMDHYSEVAYYTVGRTVMTLLEEPEVPLAPDNPLNRGAAAKKGFAAGAGLCCAAVLALSYWCSALKRESDIEKKLDARSLGAIGYERKYKTPRELLHRSKAALLADSPLASQRFAEDYKRLAARVEYRLGRSGGKVLVITSVSENEGKSTLAANLAITLAARGKRVLLVDGDIRRPAQFLILGVDVQEKNELGEYLKGSGTPTDVILPTDRPRLFFLGGRGCYSSSTELLRSQRLPHLLEQCRQLVDFILIDTPPVGLIGDAQVFSQYADGVILTARQNYMLAEDINEVLDDFADNRANVLGVVLNGEMSFDRLLEQLPGAGRAGYGRHERGDARG